MEEPPPAGAAIVRPSSQPQLAAPASPPVPGGGGGMDCPNRKRSAVAGELPEDSLAEILERVPIRCLYRSKCVAKAWRDVIEDPFHRKRLPQTLQGFFLIKQEIGGLRIDYTSLLARPALLQIDRSPSFLTELPWYGTLAFTDSCNGLLLFERQHLSPPFDDFVVWNPATKQWGNVPRYAPRYGPLSSSMYCTERCAYLVFDPAISTHFHLVQYLLGCNGDDYDEDDNVHDDDDHESVLSSVHVYSSEAGQWIHRFKRWSGQGLRPCQGSSSALLNGMLHFITLGQHHIVAVDAKGFTHDFIPVPKMMAENKSWLELGYVAQSQGRLHYIKQAADAQLSIWVLVDYNTREFVLKHSVSFMELFGKTWQPGYKNGYSVVGMHPDGNVVFIVQNWDLKLISYNMDHKIVSVIGTLENDTLTMDVVPYVPCFLELPALTNKH